MQHKISVDVRYVNIKRNRINKGHVEFTVPNKQPNTNTHLAHEETNSRVTLFGS